MTVDGAPKGSKEASGLYLEGQALTLMNLSTAGGIRERDAKFAVNKASKTLIFSYTR